MSPDPNKFITDERLPDIIDRISKILNANGLPVKERLESSDINVEIHYANAKDKPIGSGLVIHQDNNGAISGFLHTFIVYLDIECMGGELDIYSNNGKALVESIKVKTENPETKNIVMFNGGLYHKPQPITDGKRVIVSYQLRQNNLLHMGGGNPTTVRRLTPPPEGEDSCPNSDYDKEDGDGNNNNWAA